MYIHSGRLLYFKIASISCIWSGKCLRAHVVTFLRVFGVFLVDIYSLIHVLFKQLIMGFT